MKKLNSYQENSNEKPLDNDALTRLIYLHDDDITRLFEKIHALEKRVLEWMIRAGRIMEMLPVKRVRPKYRQ